jgi:hypothetical protein
MKLHVVFDRDGKILAAAQGNSKTPLGVWPMPDEKHGEKSADVDVPGDFDSESLAALCGSMIVATDGKQPRLVPGEHDTGGD